MSLFSDMHYVTFQRQVQKDMPKQSSFTSFQKLAICAAYNSCVCTAPAWHCLSNKFLPCTCAHITKWSARKDKHFCHFQGNLHLPVAFTMCFLHLHVLPLGNNQNLLYPLRHLTESYSDSLLQVVLQLSLYNDEACQHSLYK